MQPCLSRCTPLLCLVLFGGCSTHPEENQVELSGKVLYRGKPLPGGAVTFVSPKGYASEATIGADGSYQTRVPIGNLKISVDNRRLEKKRPILDQEGRIVTVELRKGSASGSPPQEKIPGEYVSIPNKYYSLETSGLTYTATGAQTFDIQLE